MTYYKPQSLTTQSSRNQAGIQIASLFFASQDKWALGYPDQALAMIQQGLTLAEALSHPFTLAFARYGVAMTHRHRREADETYEQAEALLALSHAQGFAPYVARGTMLQGWALAAKGHAQQGLAHMRHYLEAHPGEVDKAVQANFLTLLADVHVMAGETEAGLDVLSQALALVDATDLRFYEAELYRLQALSHLRQPVPDERLAEDLLHHALDIARRQHAMSIELRVSISLSRLWQRQGNIREARDRLAKIHGWFTEGFDTVDLQEANRLIEALKAPAN